MRPNAFQKILFLIYFFLFLLCCVFYVPFRDFQGRYKTEIVYDAIWSGNSNIDLYRIGIYILILGTSFYFLYKFLNRMNDLEPDRYKKSAKKELFVFIIFISGILLCLTYQIGTNWINQFRKKSLTEKIEKTQTLITEKSVKRSTRSSFWSATQAAFASNVMVTKGDDTYRVSNWDVRNAEREGYSRMEPLMNLNDFDNNIQTFWRHLLNHKDNPDWLNSFFFYFSDNHLKEFNIKNENELKVFIENNNYNDDDFKKQEEVKVLTTELNSYQTKKDSLTFYQDKDIRRITLIFLAILFGILYLARPLILFIKGIFLELK